MSTATPKIKRSKGRSDTISEGGEGESLKHCLDWDDWNDLNRRWRIPTQQGVSLTRGVSVTGFHLLLSVRLSVRSYWAPGYFLLICLLKEAVEFETFVQSTSYGLSYSSFNCSRSYELFIISNFNFSVFQIFWKVWRWTLIDRPKNSPNITCHLSVRNQINAFLVSNALPLVLKFSSIQLCLKT